MLRKTLLAAATFAATFTAAAIAGQSASAADLVRLGNLKFAHYGAVSYMKENTLT